MARWREMIAYHKLTLLTTNTPIYKQHAAHVSRGEHQKGVFHESHESVHTNQKSVVQYLQKNGAREMETSTTIHYGHCTHTHIHTGNARLASRL